MELNAVKRLAVIPSDPLSRYLEKGIVDRLESYYNPSGLFDEVFLLSSLESCERAEFGMHIIPTHPYQLRSRLRELEVDVVRAYGGYWACDMACEHKRRGIPVIVSVHNSNPEMLHHSIRRADLVICMSRAVVRLVEGRGYVPRDRIVLLPNRVDFGVFRPQESDAADLRQHYPGKYHILHIGRKEREKNQDTVLRALSILGEEYTGLFVGVGSAQKQYEQLAHDLEIEPRCYFIPSIANRELPRYYSWCDCMCTPSRSEGFGIVFVEALACESVVVTSDIAPMNEYITDGHDGILVKDFEDPVSLAKAIARACTDDDLRRRLKANARGNLGRFSKENIDGQEAQIYATMLKRKAEGRFGKSHVGYDLVGDHLIDPARDMLAKVRQCVPQPIKRVLSRKRKWGV